MKRTFKNIFKACVAGTASILGIFRPLGKYLAYIRDSFYSEWKRREFKESDGSIRIVPKVKVIGGKYISVGRNVYICKNSVISAWGRYLGQRFDPHIRIGDGCGIGDGAHITAINSIRIGNGVLMGKYVLITDNAHGDISPAQITLPPRLRELCSKGEVVIGDNVWIGEKASILPGVRIGNNSIIAANAVVTCDIPEYCVAAGVPAKVIKRMEH